MTTALVLSIPDYGVLLGGKGSTIDPLRDFEQGTTP
jgi:hypothetical protein